jgi:hypothetical protein
MQLALISNENSERIARLIQFAKDSGLELRMLDTSESDEYLFSKLIDDTKKDKRHSSTDLKRFLDDYTLYH